MKNLGKALEYNTLPGILQFELVSSEILIFPIHRLNLDVISETFLDVFVSANIELNVPKVFHSARFIFDIYTGDVRPHLPTKEFR